MSEPPSPTGRMPSAPLTSDTPVERPPGRWHTAGLVLLAVWAALLGVAVVLWLKVALFPGGTGGPDGYLVLFGAPFMLVALALLWWAWRSARALRRGRREGWTLLLVLGGIAVMQVVLTARPLLAPAGSDPTAGAEAGAPPGLAAGLLGAIVLGLASLAVALVGRRSRPPEAEPDDGVTEPG